MGFETIIYGYIRLNPGHRKHNETVFVEYPYDDRYPFPNIFSDIRPGYGGDIVSFAGSLKSLDEDWGEWQERFEGLLRQLRGQAARVELEHETDGDIKSVAYLCPDGWESTIAAPDRTWTRYCREKDT